MIILSNFVKSVPLLLHLVITFKHSEEGHLISLGPRGDFNCHLKLPISSQYKITIYFWYFFPSGPNFFFSYHFSNLYYNYAWSIWCKTCPFSCWATKIQCGSLVTVLFKRTLLLEPTWHSMLRERLSKWLKISSSRPHHSSSSQLTLEAVSLSGERTCQCYSNKSSFF